MRVFCSLFISLMAFNAMAESLTCTGKVERIAYHQPDSFYLKVGDSAIMKVCDAQEKFFRTNPEGCKLIISLATTARATNKDVGLTIDNAPSSSCSSISNWAQVDVRFFEILK